MGTAGVTETTGSKIIMHKSDIVEVVGGSFGEAKPIFELVDEITHALLGGKMKVQGSQVVETAEQVIMDEGAGPLVLRIERIIPGEIESLHNGSTCSIPVEMLHNQLDKLGVQLKGGNVLLQDDWVVRV